MLTLKRASKEPPANEMPSAKVDEILARIGTRENRNARFRARPAAAAVFVMVCAGREAQLALPDELAALRAAQEKWSEYQSEIESLGHDAASAEVKKALATYIADGSPKGFAKLRDTNLSKRSLQEQKDALRAAVKKAMQDHCAATTNLVLPVLVRALAMVDEEVATLRSAEEKTAERYGVPFAPSPTLAGLIALGFAIENTILRAAENSGVRVPVTAHLAGILKL